MKCPACGGSLKQGIDKHSQTEIDYCRQCKGIWLDEAELQAVCQFAVEEFSLPGDAELTDRCCPRCLERMYEFEYPETMVKVDRCQNCMGYWFDAGELKEVEVVRRNWTMQHARKAAREKRVTQKNDAEMSSRPLFGKSENNNELDFSFGSKKAKLLAKLYTGLVSVLIFAFVICVSYYDEVIYHLNVSGAKKEMKQSFAAMDNYDQYQDWINDLINTRHKEAVQSTTGERRTHHRRLFRRYERYLDEEKYRNNMYQYIRKQAIENEKEDVVEWIKKGRKKTRK